LRALFAGRGSIGSAAETVARVRTIFIRCARIARIATTDCLDTGTRGAGNGSLGATAAIATIGRRKNAPIGVFNIPNQTALATASSAAASESAGFHAPAATRTARFCRGATQRARATRDARHSTSATTRVTKRLALKGTTAREKDARGGDL